jgi:hypothetical protein
MTSLTSVVDATLPALLRAPCAVLIVTRTDCRYCAVYEAALADLLAQGGLPGVVAGKMTVDQPGVEDFLASEPWLARLAYLPYHLLYRRGQLVDGFASANPRFLYARVERLRRRTPAPDS